MQNAGFEIAQVYRPGVKRDASQQKHMPQQEVSLRKKVAAGHLIKLQDMPGMTRDASKLQLLQQQENEFEDRLQHWTQQNARDTRTSKGLRGSVTATLPQQ